MNSWSTPIRPFFRSIAVVLLFATVAKCQTKQLADPAELAESIESQQGKSVYLDSLGFQCAGTIHTLLNHLSLRKGGHHAVIQIYGDECDSRLIVAFEESAGRWSQIGTFSVLSHYGEQPSVTFPELVRDEEQEIMVRNQLVDWGTGVRQKNMTVYKWVGDHFEAIFDQPEVVTFETPIGNKGKGSKLYRIAEQSEFEVRPSTRTSNTLGLKYIHEKQILKTGTAAVTRFRNWTWDPALFRFRCFETAP